MKPGDINLQNALLISDGVKALNTIHDLEFTNWASSVLNQFKSGDFGDLEYDLLEEIKINYDTVYGFVVGKYIDPNGVEIWVGQSLPYESIPTMFLPHEY